MSLSVVQEVKEQGSKVNRSLLGRFLGLMRHASGDSYFEVLVTTFGCAVIVIIALAVIVLTRGSLPAWANFGINFLTGTDWISLTGAESYGALPFILGTLVTSAIAVALGVPISLGIATFLAEMAPSVVRVPLSQLIELLAAVPSVVYGFWGLFVFRIWLADYVETPLSTYLGGWIPLFRGPPQDGINILTAGVILAIMIIPTIASISKEVMMAVPMSQREAAYSLGATRWEVVRMSVINYSRSGIFGAGILGLGRAVGETMAVTMIIGNSVGIAAVPTSLLNTGGTLSSIIAIKFGGESSGPLLLPSLIGMGLILLAFALLINVFAHLMVSRVLKVTLGRVE